MKNGPRGIAFHQSSAGSNRNACGKFISTLVVRLTRNPILKVLSSIRAHRVRALLMGGQACVFYSAAEFSRDTDLASQASTSGIGRNGLRRLKQTFRVPQAKSRLSPHIEDRSIIQAFGISVVSKWVFRSAHLSTRFKIDESEVIAIAVEEIIMASGLKTASTCHGQCR